jgi:hypothetical protein
MHSMRFSMDGQPLPLVLAMGACVIVFIVSFFMALYATLMAGGRTGGWADRPEDRGLSWGERAGRKNSRGNRFFVAEEFRFLRRLLLGAWLGAFGSFGLLSLLMAVFGHRG